MRGRGRGYPHFLKSSLSAKASFQTCGTHSLFNVFLFSAPGVLVPYRLIDVLCDCTLSSLYLYHWLFPHKSALISWRVPSRGLKYTKNKGCVVVYLGAPHVSQPLTLTLRSWQWAVLYNKLSDPSESYLMMQSLCMFQSILKICCYVWTFMIILWNTEEAQRFVAPTRPIFSRWTPFWSHFVEKKRQWNFHLFSFVGPGSPQPRPSPALALSLKVMPMFLNFSAWWIPRFTQCGWVFMIVATCQCKQKHHILHIRTHTYIHTYIYIGTCIYIYMISTGC